MTQNPESPSRLLDPDSLSLLVEAYRLGFVLVLRGTPRASAAARLHQLGALDNVNYGTTDAADHRPTDLGRRWVEALLATPCPEPPPLVIEPGARYRTREGGTARVLCVDRVSDDYPVVALVNPPGPTPRERPTTYTRDGFALIGTSDHYLDLIERIDQP